ncbi:MAG: methylenetetrahydrofolate--tRNA-(uracil(54)-C(5))-methyltransferase (FADH(2)-oxidizing) TrmFO [Deltaproteobacteria bacterium]|nr:methylenetetrahydrofolate--tRNA-(uracil(54)-C(5))-methyltransferase (FADH(2)-oxidizing) TrmFO [Deltaproteobacteria bacterium]
MDEVITIIGGGLAGCEAAWQIARRGGRAVIYEQRPGRSSPAHTTDALAELVCSNSLKSARLDSAAGLLKAEMRLLDSLIIKAAESTSVAAGATLAVDRAAFSTCVGAALERAGVEVIRAEATAVPDARPLVIATGPLTSDAFAQAIAGLVGRDALFFHDAVAPIVYKDSINMRRAFLASRYGKGEADYINCPLEAEEYERFYNELAAADAVSGHGFDDLRHFDACMPIEAMAKRGAKTLLFGPMRPVGLVDPSTGRRQFAVVQLRSENREGTLYNIVGFQTRLRYPDQKKVFRLIPALANAEFARLGKMHRNSYIESPVLLTPAQQLRRDARIFFAGQITGVEGYCESALSGLFAGINAFRLSKGMDSATPPRETMSGGLMAHVSGSEARPFAPMNANMGLVPLGTGKDRKERAAERALSAMEAWIKGM